MAIRVWIEEEYGFANFIWTHPGSMEDVVADWKAGRVPVNFWGLRPSELFVGTCEEFEASDFRHKIIAEAIEAGEIAFCEAVKKLDVGEYRRTLYGADAMAHIHEDDDSWLRTSAGEMVSLPENFFGRPNQGGAGC